MSTQETNFQGFVQPPPSDGAREPLVSVDDLFVHFDLGVKRVVDNAGRRRVWQWSSVLALASVSLLLLIGWELGGFRSGLLVLIIVTIVAFVVSLLIFSRILLILFGQRVHRIVKAVDGVSLEIYPGETLGLVGESGCGKSTLGMAILRLTQPTGGTVRYRGEDLSKLSSREMRQQRRHQQIVFQDPYASLNPRMTVGQIVGEPIKTFKLARGREVETLAQDLLETVGLSKRFIKRYPHEFSGGQRQRIGIARSLAVEPEFIVADEPISALDVSIQAQIMNLLAGLQREKNLTYLFISHDLRAIRHVSTRVAVMYLGRLVEIAESKTIYADPLMPYTKALISAVPVPDPQIEAKRQRIVLEGDVPSPINPPSGCRFHTRCPYMIEACKKVDPPLVEIKPNHFAACIRISPEQPDIERVPPGEAPGLAALGLATEISS